jgi:transportin-1
MKVGDKMAPFVPAIMQKLMSLLMRPNLNRNLLQNTAITIGRIGYVCPEILAPRLEEFVESWCIALLDVRDEQEKEPASRALVKMIKLNPNGVIRHFVAVCDMIVSLVNPPNDLKESFYQILHGFKNSMQPQNWTRYIASFPEHIARSLSEQYQI